MGETAKRTDAGVLDADLWDAPWLLTEDELRLHAGDRWSSGLEGAWEDEE